jgi:hypothetical protein
VHDDRSEPIFVVRLRPRSAGSDTVHAYAPPNTMLRHRGYGVRRDGRGARAARRWRDWLLLLVAIGTLSVVAAQAAGVVHTPGRPNPVLSKSRGAVSIVNSRRGQAVLSAANMAPGQSVSGTVSLLNDGTASGTLALFARNLASPPGPGGGTLADVLEIRVQDLTSGGSTVFEGPLDSLSTVALGGIGVGQRRTYLITAALPAELGNEYAGASAQVDFVWNTALLHSRARCAALFRGGNGSERLIGTVGGDRIQGRGSGDVVRGHGGRDCLYGERGEDRLFGGRGDDQLDGGPGNDLLVGGSGADVLRGGSGDDRLVASGAHRDIVRCGSGFDRAWVDRFDVTIGCEQVVRR